MKGIEECFRRFWTLLSGSYQKSCSPSSLPERISGDRSRSTSGDWEITTQPSLRSSPYSPKSKPTSKNSALVGIDGRESPFFTAEEFRCRCGGRHGVPCQGYPRPGFDNQGIDFHLVTLLDKVRQALGHPIHITSGYRCPAHNTAIGGVEGSFHTQGMAADIVSKVCSPKDLMLLVEAVAGPPGLGIYDGFVHIDTRKGWSKLARWDKRTRLK